MEHRVAGVAEFTNGLFEQIARPIAGLQFLYTVAVWRIMAFRASLLGIPVHA